MAKVQKPSSAALHPKSRKAQLRKRQLLRSIKISSQKSSGYSQKCIPLIDRLTWFQLFLSSHQPDSPPTPDQIQEAIVEYINRNAPAMSDLEGEWRADRPIPKKLQELRELKRMEEEEFSTKGIELPTLHAKKEFAKFCSWNGDYNSINQFEMKRYHLALPIEKK
jgi:hypothetical protein